MFGFVMLCYLITLLPMFAQTTTTMVNVYMTIQSVGLGMIAITLVMSVMYLIKNMAERTVATTPEGDLIAQGLVKGRDGKRPATIERDLQKPWLFALFPVIVIAPAAYVLVDSITALIAGIGAGALGVFAWWLIPRMPASDLLYDAAYRVTLVAAPVVAIALVLRVMVAYTHGVPAWTDTLSPVISVGGLILYGLYLLLGRLPRFRGEPVTYLNVIGFVLLFAGLIVNAVS
ncbi:hypothetical protein [Stomatohabitans albus]|uniref:hypothetical protein n=1 Tax=Stomatohabitans albus TaxID=3110766 RepID=UPI00300D25EB